MGDPIAYHMHMREHRMIQNEWMDKLEKEAKNKAKQKSQTAKAHRMIQNECMDKLEKEAKNKTGLHYHVDSKLNVVSELNEASGLKELKKAWTEMHGKGPFQVSDCNGQCIKRGHDKT